MTSSTHASSEANAVLRSCFIPSKTADGSPFNSLKGLLPADAEDGGMARLLTTTLPSGEIVAIKRFHATRELDGALFAQHEKAAEDEFERLCALDGADGHAPRAWALGSCFDERGCEHPAIVMDFIDGFTLEYACRSSLLSGGTGKRDKTRSIMEAGLLIARALRACAAFTHRDLNPRNVMLIMDRCGTARKAVLIDFGQSEQESNPLVTPSVQPHRLATVSFGAPEMYGGPFYFMRNNASVDVYSLGSLLYYLRVRRIPFLELATLDATQPDHARSIVQAKQVTLDMAEAMGPSLRDIDQRLAELVATCTAFDPRDRPGIDDVIASIEEWLGEATPERDAQTTANQVNPNEEGGWQRPQAPSLDRENPGDLLQRAQDCFYGHNGQTRDARLAHRCLEQAARANNAEAHFQLGRSFAFGRGTQRDLDQARHWLTSAVSLGHPGAAATLKALDLAS